MNDLPPEPQVHEAVTGRPEGYRVLQVLPELHEGGVERGTQDIALHLARNAWMPLVASAGGEGEAALTAAGVRTFRLPLASKNPLQVQANSRRLARLIREHRVDLVHARSRAPAWSARAAARRCGVPFVTTFHGVYSGSHRWLKRRYNAIMVSGDLVIAISEYVADHILATFGIPPGKLRLVRRGVDLAAFDPAALDEAKRAELRQSWGIPADHKVVMLPGRISRRKGHIHLIRALARIRRSDIACVFVGSYDPTSTFITEVQGLIGATGQAERIRLVGSTPDMPEALSLADVVVVPSVDPPEAFGRVSVEAQAMGRPVIVSDNGGLGESIMPAATGWLVPPGEPAALAHALGLALAMPPDARERLAARARRFVARTYGLERMADETLAVYRELIAPPTAATTPSGPTRRRRGSA